MADEDQGPPPDPVPESLRAEIDWTSYDWEELEPPEWITDLDREILAKLGNTGVIMTPSIIAKNIDRSRSSVSRRLSTLEAGEMVEKVERGHYRITDEGCARMIEKVTSEDLEGIPDNFVGYKIRAPGEIDTK